MGDNFDSELWAAGATCLANHAHKDTHPQCSDKTKAATVAKIKTMCKGIVAKTATKADNKACEPFRLSLAEYGMSPNNPPSKKASHLQSRVAKAVQELLGESPRVRPSLKKVMAKIHQLAKSLGSYGDGYGSKGSTKGGGYSGSYGYGETSSPAKKASSPAKKASSPAKKGKVTKARPEWCKTSSQSGAKKP